MFDKDFVHRLAHIVALAKNVQWRFVIMGTVNCHFAVYGVAARQITHFDRPCDVR